MGIAAIWARVSTEEQQSLDYQVAEVKGLPFTSYLVFTFAISSIRSCKKSSLSCAFALWLNREATLLYIAHSPSSWS